MPPVTSPAQVCSWWPQQRGCPVFPLDIFDVNVTNMKSDDRRPYRMTNRAEAANATAERILDAVTELFWERPTDQVVLRDVADRAGVTVQTVIRKFGGKEALLAAAADRAMSRTEAERAVLARGRRRRRRGAPRALRAGRGPGCSGCSPRSRPPRPWRSTPTAGRALHRDWCRTVFAATLERLSGVDAQAPPRPARRRVRRLHLEAAPARLPGSAAARPRSPSTSCSGRSCIDPTDETPWNREPR